MRSRLTVPVICSECGKELRGTPMGRGGFRVRSHKQADGRPCLGHDLLFTHKRAEVNPFGPPDMTVPDGENDADWLENRQIDGSPLE